MRALLAAEKRGRDEGAGGLPTGTKGGFLVPDGASSRE